MHFVDRLFAAMQRAGNPVVVGIDPRAEELPTGFLERFPASFDGVSQALGRFGCEVVDVSSEPASVGEVTDVDRESGLLVVQPLHGEQVLIPFAKAYLVKIDTAGKRIEMRLPDGLLDINAPVSEDERRFLETTEEGE